MTKLAKCMSALALVLVLTCMSTPAIARTGLRIEKITEYEIFPSWQIRIGGSGIGSCGVKIERTNTSTVAKRSGSRAGTARVEVKTNACTEGNAGILVGGRRVTGLQGPYEFVYESFEGELPNIRAVTTKLNGMSLWITEPLGTTCQTNAAPIRITTTGGNPATGSSVATAGIPLEGACSLTEATITGEASMYEDTEGLIRTSERMTLI